MPFGAGVTRKRSRLGFPLRSRLGFLNGCCCAPAGAGTLIPPCFDTSPCRIRFVELFVTISNVTGTFDPFSNDLEGQTVSIRPTLGGAGAWQPQVKANPGNTAYTIQEDAAYNDDFGNYICSEPGVFGSSRNTPVSASLFPSLAICALPDGQLSVRLTTSHYVVADCRNYPSFVADTGVEECSAAFPWFPCPEYNLETLMGDSISGSGGPFAACERPFFKQWTNVALYYTAGITPVGHYDVTVYE